jgi:2,4-dienoyl-CoA reductase-like NADH-dependent reductase (Old Yellow Enzyme family)
VEGRRSATARVIIFGELPMEERNTNNAPNLFSAIEVGRLVLRNRVVMAPLTRSRAGPGNVPNQLNALYYAQRASTGLIISEATQISPEGLRLRSGCLSRGRHGGPRPE